MTIARNPDHGNHTTETKARKGERFVIEEMIQDREIKLDSLTPLAIALYFLMATYTNHTRNDIRVSASTLAQILGSTRQTITTLQGELVKEGLISKVGKTREGVIVYRLVRPADSLDVLEDVGEGVNLGVSQGRHKPGTWNREPGTENAVDSGGATRPETTDPQGHRARGPVVAQPDSPGIPEGSPAASVFLEQSQAELEAMYARSPAGQAAAARKAQKENRPYEPQHLRKLKFEMSRTGETVDYSKFNFYMMMDEIDRLKVLPDKAPTKPKMPSDIEKRSNGHYYRYGQIINKYEVKSLIDLGVIPDDPAYFADMEKRNEEASRGFMSSESWT